MAAKRVSEANCRKYFANSTLSASWQHFIPSAVGLYASLSINTKNVGLRIRLKSRDSTFRDLGTLVPHKAEVPHYPFTSAECSNAQLFFVPVLMRETEPFVISRIARGLCESRLNLPNALLGDPAKLFDGLPLRPDLLQ